MNDVDLKQLAIDRTGSAEQRMSRRPHLLTRYVLPGLLLTCFAVLVVWSSWDLLFPPKPVKVTPVLATQSEVRRAGTSLFKAAGWIEPRPTAVRVAALAPGVVEQLLVVEDQAVKAGEPVAELIKDDAKLALERAEADFNLRDAERDEAEATLVAAEARLKQPVHLQAALGEAEALLAKNQTELKNLPFETRRAEAQRKFAQSNYEGKVAAKGAVSNRSIDQARSELDSAGALVEELKNRIDSLKIEQAALTQRRNALKKQLELLVDEIRAKAEATARVKAAVARVEQARVAVSEVNLRLERMTVRSPVDGRVYQLVSSPGARIGSGMAPMSGHDSSTIVTLYRPEMLQIRVDVRFEDIPKVRLGQSVQIENAALSTPLTGNVLFVGSEADIQKNTLEVKVEIPSAPSVLKPEMLMDVTFLAVQESKADTKSSKEMRLYLPSSLVREGDAGPFVWLADQSAGVARKTPVKTGAVGMDGLIEITDGLAISSRIITSDTEDLRDGDRIRVTGEESNFTTGTTNPLPSGEKK